MAHHLNDTQKQEILQKAQVICIIGLSPDSSKSSYGVAEFLLSQGKQIVPIYPRGGNILGCRAYISIKEAWEALMAQGRHCDIINIFRKSEALGEVLSEISCLQGIAQEQPCIWVQLGLQNAQAYQIATSCGLMYEEDSCIAIEYQRLC